MYRKYFIALMIITISANKASIAKQVVLHEKPCYDLSRG